MMTDKQLEEKKREFFDTFLTEIEHYQGESEPLIESFIRDDKVEDLWQWITELVEEVEREKSEEIEELKHWLKRYEKDISNAIN